jgi:hypothetical protein
MDQNYGDEYERLLSEGDRSDTDDRHDDKHPQSSQDQLQPRQQPVEIGQKVAYGFGHVFNDITATIWFSYTMVYMQDVVGMSPAMAGFLLFFGLCITL